MSHLSFIPASLALEGIVSEVGYADEAADIADVYAVGIRALKQPLFHELGSTVSNLTISLHLAKTETTVTERNKQILQHVSLFRLLVEIYRVPCTKSLAKLLRTTLKSGLTQNLKCVNLSIRKNCSGNKCLLSQQIRL